MKPPLSLAGKLCTTSIFIIIALTIPTISANNNTTTTSISNTTTTATVSTTASVSTSSSAVSTTTDTNSTATQDPQLEESPCSVSREGGLASCHGANTTSLLSFLDQLRETKPGNTNTSSDDDDTTNTTTTTTPGQDTTHTTTTNTSNSTEHNATTSIKDEENATVITGLEEDYDVGTNFTNDEPSKISGDSSVVVELSFLSCHLPTLTAATLHTPTPLEVLSVVSSGVSVVANDALDYHKSSLRRLNLAFNLLTALPLGKANLTQLEVLDLRHNLLEYLSPSNVLASLPHLRQLHLDHNRLGEVPSATSHGLGVLGEIGGMLTHLTLSHNYLTTLPTTLTLPSLTRLDLSHNRIHNLPADALKDLTNLQFLDLSENHLSALTPTMLPNNILSLKLAGNPWNCSCDSHWLLKLNTSTTAPDAITTPSCATPLHLRHRDLASLTEAAICPSKWSTSDTKVVYIGDQVDGPLSNALASLHLLNVTSLNHQGLLVSWRVEASFYSSSITDLEPLSWAITLREAKQDSREVEATQMRLTRYRRQRPKWIPADTVFTEVLDGLQEETMYVLCLTPVQDERIYYIRPDHCLHGSTLPRLKNKVLPDRSHAISPPTSTPKIATLLSTSHYSIKTEMVTITSASHSVNLSWNVTIFPHHQSYVLEGKILRPLGWRITYRRFSEDEETEVVLVSRGGEALQNFTNQYAIRDLEPRTGYVFCFHSLTEVEIEEILAGSGGGDYVGGSSNGGRLQNMTPTKSYRSESSLSTVPNLNDRTDHHSTPTHQNSFQFSATGSTGPIQNDLATTKTLLNDPRTFSPDPQNSRNTNPVINDPDLLFPDPSTAHSVFPPSTFQTTNPTWNDPINTNPAWHDLINNNPVWHDSISSNPILEDPEPTNPIFQDPRNTHPMLQNPRPTNPVLQDPRNTHPLLRDPWSSKPTEQDLTSPFSKQGTGRSFHRNPPSVSSFPASSNIPPLPNMPTLPSSRPPRPPRPQSGGNFVYTSTGERIRLPSIPPGAGPPFNIPVVGPAIVTTSEKPRQRYIYEFDDNDEVTTTESPTNNTNKRTQFFTYETTRRKRRSLNTESPMQYEKFLDSGVVQICREVVTLAAYDELITPVAIASTVSSSTTVAVVILFCCCCWPRRCKKKKRQEGWSIKRTYTPRQIGNISAPSPVNVFSGHTSMMNGGSVVGERDGGLTQLDKTARSISVASSSGYLTPLQLPNGVTLDPSTLITEGAVTPNQRAYLSLLKNRLLQKHKDNPDFHPGYDIPPQSHTKTMHGYDYPHPTPVNAIGGDGDKLASRSRIFPALPSPSSSSDSNYNATVANLVESKKNAQVNLNIPLSQDKSSNINKSFDMNDSGMIGDFFGEISGDYNYASSPDGASPSQVPYIKNAPQTKNNHHRKFGFTKKDLESQGQLSRSVPDLANPEELDSPQPQSPVSLPVKEHNGYANVILPPKKYTGRNQGDNQLRMHPNMYHTWSSTRQPHSKGHPSLGEVVLSGGTLIEVPEGYVVPKPPKPAPSIKLLVRGGEADKSTEDKKDTDDVPQPPERDESLNHKEPSKKRPGTPRKSTDKSKITHLMTPESEPHRLVINTGMAI